MDTRKAIGYVRVSTEEQASGGHSLGAQAAKLRQYAALYEIELVEIIEDAGASAKTLERPGLQRALQMLRDGEAGGLLIAKLDRLTRSVGDLAVLLDGYFGEKAGKHLYSVADAIDTRSAAGRMVLNILTSVAQWEREAIGERTRAALQHKISKGERVGRVRYGYELAADGALIEDAKQQAGISKMHAWRNAGLSLRDICKQLDVEGFSTKDGKPWQAATVRQILGRK